MEHETQKSNDKKFWCWIIILAILIFGGIYLYKNNDGFKNATNTATNKNLSQSDVNIEIDQSLTGISITVEPYVNVKDIKIEYEILNSNNSIIKSGYLTKSDLEKNKSYSYDLGLSFTELLNARSVKCRMVSGTKA